MYMSHYFFSVSEEGEAQSQRADVVDEMLRVVEEAIEKNNWIAGKIFDLSI